MSAPLPTVRRSALPAPTQHRTVEAELNEGRETRILARHAEFEDFWASEIANIAEATGHDPADTLLVRATDHRHAVELRELAAAAKPPREVSSSAAWQQSLRGEVVPPRASHPNVGGGTSLSTPFRPTDPSAYAVEHVVHRNPADDMERTQALSGATGLLRQTARVDQRPLTDEEISHRRVLGEEVVEGPEVFLGRPVRNAYLRNRLNYVDMALAPSGAGFLEVRGEGIDITEELESVETSEEQFLSSVQPTPVEKPVEVPPVALRCSHTAITVTEGAGSFTVHNEGRVVISLSVSISHSEFSPTPSLGADGQRQAGSDGDKAVDVAAKILFNKSTPVPFSVSPRSGKVLPGDSMTFSVIRTSSQPLSFANLIITPSPSPVWTHGDGTVALCGVCSPPRAVWQKARRLAAQAASESEKEEVFNLSQEIVFDVIDKTVECSHSPYAPDEVLSFYDAHFYACSGALGAHAHAKVIDVLHQLSTLVASILMEQGYESQKPITWSLSLITLHHLIQSVSDTELQTRFTACFETCVQLLAVPMDVIEYEVKAFETVEARAASLFEKMEEEFAAVKRKKKAEFDSESAMQTAISTATAEAITKIREFVFRRELSSSLASYDPEKLVASVSTTLMEGHDLNIADAEEDYSEYDEYEDERPAEFVEIKKKLIHEAIARAREHQRMRQVDSALPLAGELREIALRGIFKEDMEEITRPEVEKKPKKTKKDKKKEISLSQKLAAQRDALLEAYPLLSVQRGPVGSAFEAHLRQILREVVVRGAWGMQGAGRVHERWKFIESVFDGRLGPALGLHEEI